MIFEKIKDLVLNYCDSIGKHLNSLLAVAAEKPCIVNGGSPFRLKAMQRVTGAFFTLHPMPIVTHFRCHIGDVKYVTMGGVLELTSPVLRVYEDKAAAANSFLRIFSLFTINSFIVKKDLIGASHDCLTMDAPLLNFEWFSTVIQSIMMHFKSLRISFSNQVRPPQKAISTLSDRITFNTNHIYPTIQ